MASGRPLLPLQKPIHTSPPCSYLMTFMISRAWDLKAITPQRGEKWPNIVQHVTTACSTSWKGKPPHTLETSSLRSFQSTKYPNKVFLGLTQRVHWVNLSLCCTCSTIGLCFYSPMGFNANVSLTQSHANVRLSHRPFGSKAICSLHIFSVCVSNFVR